jgi:hypothetical protein
MTHQINKAPEKGLFICAFSGRERRLGSTNFVWNKIERAKRGPEGEPQGCGE